MSIEPYRFDCGAMPREARTSPIRGKVPTCETFPLSCIKAEAHVLGFDKKNRLPAVLFYLIRAIRRANHRFDSFSFLVPSRSDSTRPPSASAVPSHMDGVIVSCRMSAELMMVTIGVA